MGVHFEALDEGVLLVPLDPGLTEARVSLTGDNNKRKRDFFRDVIKIMTSRRVKAVAALTYRFAKH